MYVRSHSQRESVGVTMSVANACSYSGMLMSTCITSLHWLQQAAAHRVWRSPVASDAWPSAAPPCSRWAAAVGPGAGLSHLVSGGGSGGGEGCEAGRGGGVASEGGRGGGEASRSPGATPVAGATANGVPARCERGGGGGGGGGDTVAPPGSRLAPCSTSMLTSMSTSLI